MQHGHLNRQWWNRENPSGKIDTEVLIVKVQTILISYHELIGQLQLQKGRYTWRPWGGSRYYIPPLLVKHVQSPPVIA